MLKTMICDICHKKFIVRPSKCFPDTFAYDTMTLNRRNTKDLNANSVTYYLKLCPDHLMEITNLIADKYNLESLKCTAKRWERERRHHE